MPTTPRPRWKLATIICTVFLGALFIVLLSLSALAANDAITLKRAIVKSMGTTPSLPDILDLPVPDLPAPKTFNTAVGRYASLLVARLQYYRAAQLSAPLVPPGLTELAKINSLAGPYNAWLLRDTNNTIWLVFRGTATRDEWEKDLQLQQVPFLTQLSLRSIRRIAYPKMITAPMNRVNIFGSGIGVHSGFFTIYMSIRDAILAIINDNPVTRVVITGHSLGAAQALYATLDLAVTYPSTTFDTFVFGSPRVGNSEFASALVSLPNLNSLVLLANTCDLVPNVPLAVQPMLSHPYTPIIYTHPGAAMHFFTDNRHGWIPNHMINVYIDYLSQ